MDSGEPDTRKEKSFIIKIFFKILIVKSKNNRIRIWRKRLDLIDFKNNCSTQTVSATKLPLPKS